MKKPSLQAGTAGGKAGLGPTYDLSRLSVLIAEESGAARTMLAGALNDLGIGLVRTASSGAAAIEYLRNTRPKDDRWAQNPPIDILISDFGMDPIDGLTLLQWVRCHAASPNRFMRVSLMSGSVSWERVSTGRNRGANAIFARPFTLKALGDHINGLIRIERPFVRVKSYFGPDRRREYPDAVLSERRDTDLQNEILGEGERPHLGWFDLPNYLELIATGTERGDISYFALADAHERLRPFSEDYADWVLPDLVRLTRELELACTRISERDLHLQIVRRVADRIIRQSGVLDYPLMAQAARSFLGVINSSGVPQGQYEKLAQLHIQAMEGIATNKLDARSGEASKMVVKQLSDLSMVLSLRGGRVGVAR